MKIAAELGDKKGIAYTLHQIGMIHQDQGDYDKAIIKYNESMRITKELGDKLGIATTLAQLGALNRKLKKYEEAVKYFITALAIFEELKSPYSKFAQNNLEEIKEEIGEERFEQLTVSSDQLTI